MGNLINFKQSIEYYLDLSDKSMDEGRPLLALNLLRHAKKQASKRDDYEEILLCQSQIYADMGRFYNANDVLFELLSKNLALSDCYFGLAQNFYCLDQVEMSNYYFDKLSELEPEISTEEISDFLEIPQTYFRENGYRVVYPTTSADAEHAKTLIQKGDIDGAIEILTEITKDCSNFVDARNDLVLCYMIKEEFEKALEITLQVLEENPINVLAICNQLLVNKITERPFDIDDAIVKFNKMKELTTFERTKIATTMCEFEKHDEAIKHFEIVLEENQYVETFMILLGIAYFNGKRFDESLTIFDKMLKIDNSSGIAKFYIRYVKQFIDDKNAGKRKFETLMYLPELPYEEILARQKWLKEYFETSEMRELDDENSIESEKLNWLFSGNQSRLQIAAIFAITESETVRKVDILERILMNNLIEKQVKSFTIVTLIELDAKKITLTIDGRFVSEKVKRPRELGKMQQVVQLAFNKAYSTLMLLNAKMCCNIADKTKWASQFIVENKLDIRSYEALAVIILIKLGLDNIFPEYALCDVLGANLKTLKKYKKLFKLEKSKLEKGTE